MSLPPNRHGDTQPGRKTHWKIHTYVSVAVTGVILASVAFSVRSSDPVAATRAKARGNESTTAAGRAAVLADSSSTVHGWVTTPSTSPSSPPATESLQLTPAPATPPTATAVRIDDSIHFQHMNGFGAAITESAAYNLYQLDPATRAAVMKSLFDPNTGAGISFLRQPIGASDFAVNTDYSEDDMPPGETDYAMKHFSIARDQKQILPLLRQAKALNPSLQIVASPWSPPGWMKTSGSMIDGKLIDTPAIYRAYALYLVKFLEAYKKAGVPVNFLTVQNEPQALQRNNYPGTDMSWQQEAKVIQALGPMIQAAGLKTKILGYDHNWAEHYNDVATHQQAGEDPEVDYPFNLLESGAAPWIYGTAYHCYYGNPSAQTTLKASFPQKAILFTECEGGSLNTGIQEINNWSSTITDWNIALDQNHGPHVGGCGTCNGTITINSDTKAVTYNAQYYSLAHFGKFVENGATRIASTVDNTTNGNSTIQTVAFQNPDNSIALVVQNTSSSTAAPFSVVWDGKLFQDTLPAGASATYTW